MKFNRVIIIVLDSVGVGELPDAFLYGDKGSNTLGNIAKSLGGITLPNLQKHGLGNIIDIKGVPSAKNQLSSFAKMSEKSIGKDTTTGHWEIAGLILDKPFALFPKGFPKELLDEFKEKTGCDYLGNCPASGTEIIKKLGTEHIKTKNPIVYTSADSVFQIAAHEEVIKIEELYRICEISRKICDKYNIGRVIARPFIGAPVGFTRTTRRRDYSIKPPAKTILDEACKAGLEVVGVGKIDNVFADQGVTSSVHTVSNADGIAKTIEFISKKQKGIIFANLVDFDMLYGHRNDVKGYAAALKEFDNSLPVICDKLNDDDLLFITADHGCDPTTQSTDHSREYVPLLVYNKNLKGVNLGTRKTFADIAASIAEIFNLKQNVGTSFIKELMNK